MDCKHELGDLMGVADGIVCTKCGKRFDHIPTQTEAPAEEKKAPAKRTAKKGAK